MMLISLLALAAAPQTMPAMDHPTVTCPATMMPLPAELKGWTRKHAVRAGVTAKVATTLPLGVGVLATLLPTSKITYPVHPQKPGISVSSGGIFAFTVPTAGRYRVALGTGAWIDVLTGMTPATSVSHGHGPDCTGVRKMVDFDLKPGRYLLQVAGNASATLPLMVTHMP